MTPFCERWGIKTKRGASMMAEEKALQGLMTPVKALGYKVEGEKQLSKLSSDLHT